MFSLPAGLLKHKSFPPPPTCLFPVHWQARGINLSGVRTCVVVAEERPRVALTHSFSKLFKDIGLSSRAVSTTFGSRVNVAICLQVTKRPYWSLYRGSVMAPTCFEPVHCQFYDLEGF